MSFSIIPFDGESPYFTAAVRIYVDVWGYEYRDSLSFFSRYSQFDGFVGRVAMLDNRVVGMAFGVASLPTQWWHSKVAQQVGLQHPALQNAWLLTELAVLAPYRDRRIGGQIHDVIVAAQPFPNLLLSTQVDNLDARRFYERRAWTVLHPGFAFQTGNISYVIMSRQRDMT